MDPNTISFVFFFKYKIVAYLFDETLNIVPTLQEAQDFIEMEEIERQLEF